METCESERSSCPGSTWIGSVGRHVGVCPREPSGTSAFTALRARAGSVRFLPVRRPARFVKTVSLCGPRRVAAPARISERSHLPVRTRHCPCRWPPSVWTSPFWVFAWMGSQVSRDGRLPRRAVEVCVTARMELGVRGPRFPVDLGFLLPSVSVTECSGTSARVPMWHRVAWAPGRGGAPAVWRPGFDRDKSAAERQAPLVKVVHSF